MVKDAESNSAQGFDPVIFASLLRQYREVSPSDTPQRWLLLEAAHIVGQPRFKPHLETHALMLRLALQTRDGGEVAGQIMRLLLVPLGHALGRLPAGNPGRSNISAFQRMPVRSDIAAVITKASRHASNK